MLELFLFYLIYKIIEKRPKLKIIDELIEYEKMEFFMDVSPKWWIKTRQKDENIKKYVIEKFESEFYPKIVEKRGKKLDIDESGNTYREEIMSAIKTGNFTFQFYPEDERLQISYTISNGAVHYHQTKKRLNARLGIFV